MKQIIEKIKADKEVTDLVLTYMKYHLLKRDLPQEGLPDDATEEVVTEYLRVFAGFSRSAEKLLSLLNKTYGLPRLNEPGFDIKTNKVLMAVCDYYMDLYGSDVVLEYMGPDDIEPAHDLEDE